mmetsp:Transcript_59604/g.156714  ORF Transcript_59604/g.156714 Transcript_59604/m.156714 type:complete len:239 (-) Transcript_59604:654-1370(-)
MSMRLRPKRARLRSLRGPGADPAALLGRGGPVLLRLVYQVHELLEGRPVLRAAPVGRVVVAAGGESEELEHLWSRSAQDRVDLIHLRRRHDIVLQSAQKAAAPPAVVLDDELQAVHRLPLVQDEGRPEEEADNVEEREDLHRHVPQGGERVLEDEARRQWQRVSLASPVGLVQALPQDVRHQPRRDGPADGAAEEEDPILAHLRWIVLRRFADALDQPPVGRARVHHEALLAGPGAVL